MFQELRRTTEAQRLLESGRGREIRMAAGASASTLARECGVATSTMCRWEAGESRPSAANAAAYVKAIRQLERIAAS